MGALSVVVLWAALGAGEAVEVETPPEPTPPVLALDARRSELVVRTWKEGIASGFAHNHVIRATDVEGQLTYSRDNLRASSLSVTVKVASLEVDEPALRARFGEAQPVPEADRKKVTENMLAEGQLDAKKFPTVRFVSKALKSAQEGKLIISGELTLHGVTKSITLPVTVSTADGATTGEGKVRLRLSEYGIAPYSAALGMVKNKDEVELVLRLVAVGG
jgi:polyisoprenoid-binding protein YceI